jgi:hypothetical protein
MKLLEQLDKAGAEDLGEVEREIDVVTGRLHTLQQRHRQDSSRVVCAKEWAGGIDAGRHARGGWRPRADEEEKWPSTSPRRST